jgi:hypothetical protein
MRFLNVVFFFVAVCPIFVFGADQQSPTLADNTVSILSSKEAQATAPASSTYDSAVITSTAAIVSPTCSGPNCGCNSCGNEPKVTYRHKRNIAPNAVPDTATLCVCKRDPCTCSKVATELNVPICVPPCACKDTTTVSRDGNRVVKDYGRYEVVVTNRKSGNIDVKYRKRLLNR